MENKTRIYDDIVNIDSETVKQFWDERAKCDDPIKSVLLGSAQSSGALRNKKEYQILQTCIDADEKISILDIGCGLGRWGDNLKEKASVYHGVDFSSEYVQAAQKNFKDYPNLQFFNMSATDLDSSVLLDKYDLVIMTGVVMYINDDKLPNLFEKINEINANAIYFQESVSLLPTRLTLKDFDSDDLDSKYSAIYRTSQEYEGIMKKKLPEFKIKKTDLLLDESTGARKETNARFWFLEKGKSK